jgi:hypothetical protein
MTKAKVATEVPNPVQVVSFDIKKDAAEKLKKFVEEERRLVKGRFRCFESPGSRQRIMYRKYKELQMFDKWMTDGEIYEIPLYVARHLNGVDVTAGAIDGKVGSCSYPVHGFKWDQSQPMPQSALGTGAAGEPGIPVPLVGVAKRIRRYGFESLQFDVGSE